MLKQISLVSLMVVAVADSSGLLWSQELPCAAPPAREPARKWAFDSQEALAGWRVAGDVSLDVSKGREGGRGAFDYVDRWMLEDDAEFVKTIRDVTGKDHDKDWARQGQAWDAFVNEMWAKHRRALPAPMDGWKKYHDDRYYRRAVENAK